ncbi:MAG: ABC transporter permease [Bdellovibrionaceae bacterium]|nr:ABC transporter permease [Pseudobdellovibrionaceae bacterium]
MSFASFWRRNLAFFRLAVLTNLEYRLNFLTDAVLQPAVTSMIEVTLWFALFAGAGVAEINGFGLNAYLAYAIWSAFMARLTSTWMYEFRMAEEIDSGSINSLLTRPFSFFEYYMSQFMGYKTITTVVSLLVPLLTCWIFDLTIIWDRLLPALALVFYYLLVVQTLSFIVATLAFYLNRIHALTVAKNMGLWLLSGELVPLDLFPEGIKNALTWLPFANAVYIPVGYMTGRFGPDLFLRGWITATYGLIFFGLLAVLSWKRGVARYAGTGA